MQSDTLVETVPKNSTASLFLTCFAEHELPQQQQSIVVI